LGLGRSALTGEPAALTEELAALTEELAALTEELTALVQADAWLEICAPFGLADLMNGVWRRNPRRAGLEQSRARLARHRPAERWPGVTVIPPA
jgi:hypothetical protein